jgi:hypothetical protein
MEIVVQLLLTSGRFFDIIRIAVEEHVTSVCMCQLDLLSCLVLSCLCEGSASDATVSMMNCDCSPGTTSNIVSVEFVLHGFAIEIIVVNGRRVSRVGHPSIGQDHC